MLDLLIKSTLIPERGKPADVGIKDGMIVKIGEGLEEEARHTIRAEGKVLFPSFANMHTHISMSLLRGLGADLPLMDWLQRVIWVLEGEFVSPEFVRDGALIGIAEAISSGTTLFMDMYFFEESVAEVAQRAGIRAGLGFGILDFPTKVARTPEEYLRRAKDFVREFKGRELVFPTICPHAVYTCSPDTLRKSLELALEEGVYIHTHTAETQQEVEASLQQFGRRPVEHLHSLGLLTDRTLMAHVVWTTEEEREMIKEKGAKVLHCPESNLKLASGIAPISDYVKRGIHVCLGTDGPASNDNLDMMEELSTMAKLQKGANLDAKAMDARTAFKIATEEGFRAVGIRAGRVEVGYEADLILLDTDRPHLQPLYDPVAQLVYSAKSSDIDTVICRGRVLMENRELKTIDQEEVKFIANKWKEKIQEFLKDKILR
ncbi:MAG: amidohydrolase [Aquificaceae bacterium]|jgi:5-methylthioadenosine/S-adenosylhomocysteine deaminase|uniref:amidohydrolase n=1 Tax=Hydrogenobacter sp. Uz 6-8 TaxID=3384828 RepID=UPI0030A5B94F